ncbi:predicted protein [Pyrenophora tritici-repentis Pt-1C-BFP]|uniref:Uncharacterized protein n=1 Tax=Pyrenophora tritici-repentis (strain Pt-1C-BFP) TaxID=426418 RepID=B2VST8_PYRTR|nr:uncharacterized protein PTRG_00722 [Pyrenophora tritici-repentis Pt-1C-BFP]EDU40160.1 predicted protein [Pyrenophora tritici-repentis Pt-1C-BFP]
MHLPAGANAYFQPGCAKWRGLWISVIMITQSGRKPEAIDCGGSTNMSFGGRAYVANCLVSCQLVIAI